MQNQRISQGLNQSEQLNNMLNDTTQDNNLQIILFNKGQVKLEELNNLDLSIYEENFSWLIDSEGKKLDFNKKVNLLNGVSLIPTFLEKRYGMDKGGISDVKLSEMLSIYSNNKDISVLELFNHVSQLYKEDKNSFNNIIGYITTVPEGVSISKESEEKMSEIFLNTWNSDRPLGEIGNSTINEVVVGLKFLKWYVIYNSTQISLNAIPIASNAIGYGLIMITYIKFVYNAPYNPNITEAQRTIVHANRRRGLLYFSFLGAPLILYTLKQSGLGLKDMIKVDLLDSSDTQTATTSSSKILNSGFFLLIKNKIPNWVKLLFSLFFLILFLLKLLGISSIFDIIYNVYYLKIFILSYCILIIKIIFNIFIL